MIYIVIALFVLFPAFYYEALRNRKHDGGLYYWIECFVLIIFMGIRYRVGGDSLRYESYFQYANTFSDIIAYGFNKDFAQPLWQLLQGVCKEVFDSFYALQIVHAAVVNFSFFYIAKRYCNNKFTFIVLYYFLQYLYFNTEIMRESLAVAMFLLSFPSLEKKNYFVYYVFAILAFLFHVSSIILFFIPLVYGLLSGKNRWKSVVFLLIILIGVYLLADRIIGSLVEGLFIDNESLQMKTYSVNDGNKLNIYGVIMALFLMSPIALSYIFIRYSSIDTPINRFVINMSLVLTVLGMLFLPLTRLQDYFIIPFLFIFADLIHDGRVIKKFRYSLLIASLVLLYSGILFYSSSVTNDTRTTHFKMYYPYHSIFDPVKEIEREREL